MSKEQRAPDHADPPFGYRGGDTPLTAIRRYARRVAERFRLEKMIPRRLAETVPTVAGCPSNQDRYPPPTGMSEW
jgi:hypothetical protein